MFASMTAFAGLAAQVVGAADGQAFKLKLGLLKIPFVQVTDCEVHEPVANEYPVAVAP